MLQIRAISGIDTFVSYGPSTQASQPYVNLTSQSIPKAPPTKSPLDALATKLEKKFNKRVLPVLQRVANFGSKKKMKILAKLEKHIAKFGSLENVAGKFLGKLVRPVAAAQAAYNIYNADNTRRATVSEIAGFAGCSGAMAAGAMIGAGSSFGLGTLPGALIGAGLCIGGDMTARWAADAGYQKFLVGY